jgi:thiamine biosynthesis protein ThiI
VIAGLFVVRYSEIGLKGKNRSYFEERLVRNLREAVAGLGVERIERIRGRVLVHHAGSEAAIAARIADTPGVRSFSAARPVARELDAIERMAVDLARERLARTPAPANFGVRTERIDKTFPLRSMDVSARLGAAILAVAPALRVRLDGPELEVAVEIYKDRAFVMTDWQRGPGGLPVGTGGRVALLLSGGIDSPVAGWLLQKRGCQVAPVYCHAFPFTGDAAKEKVVDLARALARRQSLLDLRVVPIAEAQVALRDRCHGELLVVLYRRFMVRVAEKIARGAGALAIGTGENLGQVASQTLTNLAAIDEAARMPLVRPLLTYDKEETIALARRIGTFEISIRPADDCCQLFLPRRPATHARLEDVLAEEAKVDVAGLLEACVAKAERVRFVKGEIEAPA